MNLKICQLEHSFVYLAFAKYLRKERVAIKKDDIKTQYIGCKDESDIVGVVGFQELAENHIRFKNDYVYKKYRGKKIYSTLWKARMSLIFMNKKVEKISAFCTKMSLPKYLKEGFIVQKINTNGITYVTKQL